MTNWSPIRCPHCGQLHEQPDADREVSRCAATLVDEGLDKLLRQRHIPLELQNLHDLRVHEFLHAKGRYAGP